MSNSIVLPPIDSYLCRNMRVPGVDQRQSLPLTIREKNPLRELLLKLSMYSPRPIGNILPPLRKRYELDLEEDLDSPCSIEII